ncbi:MAG: hypothetical protein ACJAZP_004090 [Psychromonas sp.]|jgi:hypothetical protein|uniref:hypothetical protein n=1 Tax=Psychromonas sp. TaxID=1884585 RepID=UPI0039E556A5
MFIHQGDNAADTIIACGITTTVFVVFLLTDRWQVPEYLTLCDHLYGFWKPNPYDPQKASQIDNYKLLVNSFTVFIVIGICRTLGE